MGAFRLKDISLIEDMYKGWDESLLWSCLDGSMGVAYVDNLDKPTSAQIILVDFCYFAGEPNEELVKNKPSGYKNDFVIMVSKDRSWDSVIEKVYGDKAHRTTRYAIKKEPGIFDGVKLQEVVDNMDSKYELKIIGKDIYEAAQNGDWSEYLCGYFLNYSTYEDFEKRGLGVVAVAKDSHEVVAGVSSYSVYNGGIEIEIDTKMEYRRKGLAYACAAKIILECINRGLYPSWDAQNKWSVALAEKLGYHFSHEYVAYEIMGY